MKTLCRIAPAALLFMTPLARAVTITDVGGGWDTLGFTVDWGPARPVDPSEHSAAWTGLKNGYRAGIVATDEFDHVDISFLGANPSIPSIQVSFYIIDPLPGQEAAPGPSGYDRRFEYRLGLLNPPGIRVEGGAYSAFFVMPLSVEVTDIPRWTDGPYCFCVPETGSVLLPAGGCLGALFWARRLRPESV